LYLCNIFKAFKYRLYPSEPQKELIAKHIGSSRFVYNLALETKNTAYLGSKHNFSPFDLIKQLPELKKECEWLKEVNSQSLQQSIQNMDIAFKKFFKGAGFPKFKSKNKGKQSFSIPQNVIVENNLLIIPKFKKGIDIVLHREIKGTIKSATISVTPTGKYFVSILVDTNTETPIKAPITESTTIGIDLGIKNFSITSDGEVFENPKNLRKAQSKLKYVQRKYSKNKGKRTKHRLALLHEKVANKRKDFLHKTSTKLIRENQTICLEDLAVSNMVKNHNLAQAINDVSWSTFVTMLEYKADWYGKNILRIGRFAPSSKTCNCCGYINKELTLKDREWTCPKCNSVLDRDVNAAINIKSFALKNILSGTDRKNQGKLPTLVGALTLEAHPIAFGVGG
jgi:putative transposase